MDLSFSTDQPGGGTPHHPGGLDITIHLTADQARAIGPEAAPLADWFHTAFIALAALRSGLGTGDEHPAAPPAPDLWRTVINDLDVQLIPRLEGLRDAAIRAHAAEGGTYGQLANAMDVSRSTAQSRREVITRRKPSRWELWAHGVLGDPMDAPFTDEPPTSPWAQRPADRS